MAVSPEVRALMTRLNKRLGPESVVLASQIRPLPRFSSGLLGLDVILGGGWPGNQWNEVIGGESSGKTSIVHHTIAHQQQLDPDFTTLWVAAEPYDHEWAARIGVDTSRVAILDSNAMEDCYGVMLEAAASRSFDAVVLDSYPALIANDEADKDMDQIVVSPGARITGKFFRKTGKSTKRSLVAEDRPLLAIIINQWREKVGAFSPHGTPKVTPGGLAKNYSYYTRLEITRTDWIDEKRPPKGTARIGQTMRFKTVKNKAAAPQQIASVDFYFADGRDYRAGEFDHAAEIARLAVLHEIVQVNENRTWLYHGDRKWNGLPRLIASLREEIDLADSVRSAVLDAVTAPRTA